MATTGGAYDILPCKGGRCDMILKQNLFAPTIRKHSKQLADRREESLKSKQREQLVAKVGLAQKINTDRPTSSNQRETEIITRLADVSRASQYQIRVRCL